MSGIFINYRREDSAGHAGRLYDSLRGHFNADQIFMDVDGIGVGVDYIKVIETAVGSCDVVIAVIGPRWLSITDTDGHRWLDDPDDLLTLEIGTALRRDICVIPVLVQGADLPRQSDWPPALAGLARRQSFEIRDARWTQDIDALVQGLKDTLARTGSGLKPARPVVGGRGGPRAKSARRSQLQDEHQRSEQSDEPGRDTPPDRPPRRRPTSRLLPSARNGWISSPQTWVTLAAVGGLMLVGVIWSLVHDFMPTSAVVPTAAPVSSPATAINAEQNTPLVSATPTNMLPKWATVNKRFGAALRASHSSDAEIVLMKSCGDALEIVSTTNDGWIEVKGSPGQVASGRTGYVGGARVTVGAQPATPDCSGALTFVVGSTVVAANAKDCVGVRPRGSTTAQPIGCYPNGQRFQILDGPNTFGGTDDWFKVRATTGSSPSVEGWALATFLALP